MRPRASWCAARRSICMPFCARSTRRPRASRTHYAEQLRPALAPLRRSRASTARRRWRRRATGCSSPSSGPPPCRRAVLAILDRRLEQAETLAGVASPDFRAALDRLAAATDGRDPVLADLARQVRFAYFDEPVIAAARAKVYAARGRRPGGARGGSRAPRPRRAAGQPSSPARSRSPRRSPGGWRTRRRPLAACCWRRSRAATTACARSGRSPRRSSTATGFVTARYRHEGRPRHLATAFVEPGRAPGRHRSLRHVGCGAARR